MFGTPPPDLVLQRLARDEADETTTFRRLFPALPPGGRYIVERLPGDRPVWRTLESVASAVATRGQAPPGPTGELAGLVDAVRAIRTDDARAVVTKRGTHRLTLSDGEANEILAREGSAWGTILQVLPAEQVTPGVTVRHHGGPSRHTPEVITVPERYLREYHGAVVGPRQIVHTDRFYLPDTFRHQSVPLAHHALVTGDGPTARNRWGHGTPTDLPGRYYYLDTEYPGHFGHVMTEVVGRAPGWLRALDRYPDIRPLVSLKPSQDGLRPFQVDLFRALGIDVESVAYIRPGTSYRVESLVAESAGFDMPRYAAPELAPLWHAMGARLATSSAPAVDRLFVSRGPGFTRHCHQTEELEAWFETQGFTVIHPETLPFTEQVALFRSAGVVAGFAGSGMFTMMFSDVQRRIVISSSSYTANNEFLISSITGGSLDMFWGPADIPLPTKGFDPVASQSDFSFDVSAHAEALRRAIEGRE